MNCYIYIFYIMSRQQLCNQRTFLSHNVEMDNKGILHLHLTVCKGTVSRAYQVFLLRNGGWTCILYDMRQVLSQLYLYVVYRTTIYDNNNTYINSQ